MAQCIKVLGQRTMEQFNFRKCLPLLAFLLPLSLAAKCPPGGFSLVVKQANGMNTSIRPDTAGYELFAWVDRYSTCLLYTSRCV